MKFDVPGPGHYVGGNKHVNIALTSQPKNKNRSTNLTRPGTFQQPRSKTMRANLGVFDTQEKRFRPKGL